MSVKRIGIKDLAKTIKADLAGRERAVLKAARRTAKIGARQLRQTAPIAFGEIREGIESERTETGAKIVSTAPHSGPVEEGSRPHMPPFDAILKWVQLRGMQGLSAQGHKVTRRKGVLDVDRFIARAISGRGNGVGLRESLGADHEGDGAAVDINAARDLAWAICMKIKREGTKPTWFMLNTVPFVEATLHDEIEAAIGDTAEIGPLQADGSF